MPFDPDKYLADKGAAFDPDAYLASKQPAPPEAPPETWGHYAGRQALATLPIGGMIAGGMVGAPEGGVGAVPGAALGYAAGRSMERLGRQYLLGDKEDNVASTPLEQGKQVAGDLVTGAASEMGGQVAGKVLGPLVRKAKMSDVGQYIANKLGRGAEDLATAHLRPTAAMSRDLGEAGVRAASREALDSGAIGFGSKVDTTAANLGNLTDEVGAVKGDIVGGSSAKINPSDIANQVHDQVVTPLLATSETQPIAEAIEGKAENLLKQYPGGSMTPAQLEAEKMAVQSNINYGTSSSAQSGAARDYARVLREGVENAVDDPAFTAAKRSFGNLSNAQQMAERTASTAGSGLKDLAVNTTALAHPNPLTIATAGARALTKGRMSSAGAVLLDKSSQAMQTLMSSNLFTEGQLSRIAASKFFQALKNAGDVGGSQAVATTHYVLQQTDPEYQQLLKDEQN